jgi:hypothetical protein
MLVLNKMISEATKIRNPFSVEIKHLARRAGRYFGP